MICYNENFQTTSKYGETLRMGRFGVKIKQNLLKDEFWFVCQVHLRNQRFFRLPVKTNNTCFCTIDAIYPIWGLCLHLKVIFTGNSFFKRKLVLFIFYMYILLHIAFFSSCLFFYVNDNKRTSELLGFIHFYAEYENMYSFISW